MKLPKGFREVVEDNELEKLDLNHLYVAHSETNANFFNTKIVFDKTRYHCIDKPQMYGYSPSPSQAFREHFRKLTVLKRDIKFIYYELCDYPYRLINEPMFFYRFYIIFSKNGKNDALEIDVDVWDYTEALDIDRILINQYLTTIPYEIG